ncbi:MAG: OmpA family protein, partial [Myxococcota bacterium]
GLVLNGGLEIGLSSEDVQGAPATAPYNLLFGLSYIFDPRPKVVTKIVEKEMPVEMAPPTGFLRAKLVDSTTGKPVGGAIITYPDGDYTQQASNGETGEFRSYDVTPGELRFIVTHPQYKTAKIKRTLEEGENILELKLKPEGDTATIAGTLTTPSGEPAQGVVELTGAQNSYQARLDGGKFSQIVMVGNYTVAATIPGFLTAGKDVSVKPGQEFSFKLQLQPRPEASSVTLSGNKILIEGIIPFTDDDNLAEEAKPLLDQVAALIFENPKFERVRVESHVDDKGPEAQRNEVTQRRAQMVFNYLTQRGISPKRLEAKGFGSDVPLVPNSSRENRAINRRIEFTIITTR